MQQNRTILAVDSDNFTDIAIRYTQNVENAFLLAELNGMNVDDIIPSGTVIMLPAESETPTTITTKQITEVEPTPAALLELLKQHAGTVATTHQLGHVRSGSQIRVNSDGTMEVIGGVVGQDGLSAYEVWINAGNSGTEQDFLDSLKGADGEQGEQGEQGAAVIALQVILDKDNWVNNEQTVTATGVTATNTSVITANTDDVTFNNYYFSGVRPILQLQDAVKFKCSIVPSVNLTVNILIL